MKIGVMLLQNLEIKYLKNYFSGNLGKISRLGLEESVSKKAFKAFCSFLVKLSFYNKGSVTGKRESFF